MKVEYSPLMFFSGQYPAPSVNSAFWYGVNSGLTSTASVYDPYVHFSYSSYPSNARDALASDLERIGEDFRTVVSSGAFIPLSVISTTRKSG